MRALLSAVAFALAQSALAQAPEAAAPAAPVKLMMVATGGLTGIYHPAGGAICRVVNHERRKHGLRCSPDSSSGSTANLEDLRGNAVEFAIVQSDVLYLASRGEGPYAARGRFEGLRTVFGLHAEPFTLVARKEVNARRVADLKGRRVWLGEAGSGTRQTVESLMKEFKWELDAASDRVPNLASGEDGAALCDGRIDAFLRIVGHPTDTVRMPAAICNARLVPVSGPTIAKILEARPYFAPAQIPGNLYPANPQDTNTFGVRAILSTTSSLPADDVYAFVKAVFENFHQLRKLHPALDNLSHVTMIDVGSVAPLHEGAARFYREKGWLR